MYQSIVLNVGGIGRNNTDQILFLMDYTFWSTKTDNNRLN